MRWYPGYRLDAFYLKTFLQGGVTYDQALFLFESGDSDRYNQQCFLAALQGVDLIASKDEGAQGAKSAKIPVVYPENSTNYSFQDPAVYAEMTKEEQTAETERMMKYWKNFSLHTSPRSRK